MASIKDRITAARAAVNVGDAQTDAAIAKWRVQMANQVGKIKAKYAGNQTVVELRKDVTRWWKVATEFANGAASLSNITDAEITQAKYNANNLRELRLYLMTNNLGSTIPADIKAKAVGYMTAPIEWLRSIGTPVLQKQADYADMVRSVAKLPGLGLDFAGKILANAATIAVVGGIVYVLWKVKGKNHV